MRKILKLFNGLLDNNLAHGLLKSIKPVDIKTSEYVFIFNVVKSPYMEKLYTLVSHRLATLDIASCFLYKNDLLSRYYPRFEIDGIEINNSLMIDKKARQISLLNKHSNFFEWVIEIENGKIEAEGINFFPIISNTLRSIQKRYNAKFIDEDNRPTYNGLIQSCDLLLKYFLLLKNYAKENSKKVRFVGYEYFYIPNGLFKILCDRFSNNGDVEFVELEKGYMSYFGHNLKESYITCSNLTRTKDSTAFSVSKKELSEIDDKNIEVGELLKPVSNALQKGIYSEIPTNQKTVINTIEDYRSKSKKVFVLFSHLFYDTPIDDNSPAFNGMCEWIMETIKYFKKKEDLLLIKPHPHEFMKDFPKKIPNETLASFLSNVQLSDNIILLDPHLFTIKDLSPYISCGLIWRSSVAMELAFLGLPGIIAGNPYYNVLDLNYAQSKKHYFQLLEQSHEIKVTDKQKFDVAKFIYLLQRKHVHINCIEYNSKLRKTYWNRKALKKYLTGGNQTIQSVVEKMLV